MKYVPISDLQVKTIKLLDSLIDSGKSQQEIWTALSDKGYRFRGVPTSNGKLSRSRFDLVLEHKDGTRESSFVTLIQDKRTKKTLWSSIGLY